MTVTAIELVNNGKYKVFLNDEFAFVLYKSELRAYEVKEGHELLESTYEKVIAEVIVKRAKLRALHLLEKMDRTEYQIRNKLKEGLYPSEVIDIAIDYIKSYRYVDDKKYAENYINIRKSRKSKLQIKSELKQKGVSGEVLADILEVKVWNEQDTIESLLEKKLRNMEESKKEDIEKAKQYLIRKGFSYQDINNVIKRMNKNYKE